MPENTQAVIIAWLAGSCVDLTLMIHKNVWVNGGGDALILIQKYTIVSLLQRYSAFDLVAFSTLGKISS